MQLRPGAQTPDRASGLAWEQVDYRNAGRREGLHRADPQNEPVRSCGKNSLNGGDIAMGFEVSRDQPPRFHSLAKLAIKVYHSSLFDKSRHEHLHKRTRYL